LAPSRIALVTSTTTGFLQSELRATSRR
jgi:hypothetical protein